MFTTQGEIKIRSIHGRYGLFNIGTLVTEVGTFAIKDELIEEMDEGVFGGTFVISYIDQGHFPIGDSNRVIVEVRAHLSGMELNSNDPDSAVEPESSVEQDPLDEEQPIDRDPVLAPESHDDDGVEGVDPVELFGSLWPFESPAEVRLDPTVGRSLLRQQAQWMKDHGYRYLPAQRVWLLNTNQSGGEVCL